MLLPVAPNAIQINLKQSWGPCFCLCGKMPGGFGEFLLKMFFISGVGRFNCKKFSYESERFLMELKFPSTKTPLLNVFPFTAINLFNFLKRNFPEWYPANNVRICFCNCCPEKCWRLKWSLDTLPAHPDSSPTFLDVTFWYTFFNNSGTQMTKVWKVNWHLRLMYVYL